MEVALPPLTADERTELARLAEAATPGPWWIDAGGPDESSSLVGADNHEIASLPYYSPYRREPDERFIAAARDAVPRLLADLARVEGELTKLRRSFAGHVYVKDEDYAALCRAADENGGAAYVLALKADQASAVIDATRMREERDLYRSALPYVLRPLSGGGFSVWIAGGTDSHVGDVPPGLTTAEVHALAMPMVWARLDADEKRDREHVALVEAALAEAIEQRRIDQGVLDQWQRTLGARLGVGERPCLDDVVEALARVEGDLAGAWEERERTRQWTRDLDKACAQRDAETEVLRAALARLTEERDAARAKADRRGALLDAADRQFRDAVALVGEARAEADRLRDLVRHQRGELHDAGLLTDEEYAALAGDHGAVARLEGYDEVRAESARLTRELAEARAQGMQAAADYAEGYAEAMEAAGHDAAPVRSIVQTIRESADLALAGGGS